MCVNFLKKKEKRLKLILAVCFLPHIASPIAQPAAADPKLEAAEVAERQGWAPSSANFGWRNCETIWNYKLLPASSTANCWVFSLSKYNIVLHSSASVTTYIWIFPRHNINMLQIKLLKIRENWIYILELIYIYVWLLEIVPWRE